MRRCRWLRDAPIFALLLIALAVLWSFAWMTRQPEAPLFERAESWPGVGRVVALVRARYLPAEPSAPSWVSGAASSASDLGTRGAIGVTEGPGAPGAMAVESEHLLLRVGVALRTEPAADATLLYRTRQLSEVPVRSRRGRWLEIGLADGGSAWFDEEAPRDPRPPLGDAPVPPLPLLAKAPTPERLAAARALLQAEQRESMLGPYRLLTDVDDAALFEQLAAELARGEQAYLARYHLVPRGTPLETIVLFRSESAYRALEASVPDLHGRRSAGYAGGGLVATYWEERSHLDVITTVLHEVGHLLGRRALGPALPPWLDEGLADELAWFALPLHAGRPIYAGQRFERETGDGTVVLYTGALAGLRRLLDELDRGRLLSLSRLVGEDWNGLERELSVGGGSGALLYAQSSFFFYCLLGGEAGQLEGEGGTSGARANLLRSFLAGVARSEAATGERLLEVLGADWSQLDADLRACLRSEAERAALPQSGTESGDGETR